MRRRSVLVLTLAASLLVPTLAMPRGARAQAPAMALPGAWAAENEVFYQIFVRSFRDSNGDRLGDLRGIRESLAYLKDLGVTSLLLTPINPSPFYHNYFASSFEGIDTAYGTVADWQDLVRAVHRRGMKIYLDEEIQYAAGSHPWWQESAGNPSSRYSRFIPYDGPGNTKPMSAVFNLTLTPAYDGRKIPLATLNLYEPVLHAYFGQLFADLVDPNHDGRFEDGVDGFRLDHMMDDLDAKGRFTNLFQRFWAPILGQARAANPRIRIIAEQADWGYGDDFLKRAGVDMVFAFPLQRAIGAFDGKAIAQAIDSTVARMPAGKGALVFIENHDLTRFASVVQGDIRREKVGAALAILLKGTPLIYYGQEIGMKGVRREGWTSDGNDIPDREAFEWSRKVQAPGAALWYKDTGPWWTDHFARDDDGISVEEEQGKAGSLLEHYPKLLAVRRARPDIRLGDQRVVPTDQKEVLAVLRSRGRAASLLLVNLAAEPRTVSAQAGPLAGRPLRDLLSGQYAASAGGTLRVELPAYGVKLLAPR